MYKFSEITNYFKEIQHQVKEENPETIKKQIQLKKDFRYKILLSFQEESMKNLNMLTERYFIHEEGRLRLESKIRIVEFMKKLKIHNTSDLLGNWFILNYKISWLAILK